MAVCSLECIIQISESFSFIYSLIKTSWRFNLNQYLLTTPKPFHRTDYIWNQVWKPRGPI